MRAKLQRTLFLVISSFALLFLCSCAVKERAVSVSSTFLEDRNIKAKEANLPFLHSWIDESVKPGIYRKVYFKPIRTDLISKDTWKKSASVLITSENDFTEKCNEIASYFQEQITEKLKNYPQSKITLVDFPSEGVVVFEIALTELEFSHPVARAAALVAPVPGTGPAVTAISDPHASFAARAYDGASGKLIGTFADRKFAPVRVVDLNKLTVSSTAREIVSLWAETFAEGLNKGRFEKIEEKKVSFWIW